jgi:hypothetical protein
MASTCKHTVEGVRNPIQTSAKNVGLRTSERFSLQRIASNPMNEAIMIVLQLVVNKKHSKPANSTEASALRVSRNWLYPACHECHA